MIEYLKENLCQFNLATLDGQECWDSVCNGSIYIMDETQDIALRDFWPTVAQSPSDAFDLPKHTQTLIHEDHDCEPGQEEVVFDVMFWLPTISWAHRVYDYLGYQPEFLLLRVVLESSTALGDVAPQALAIGNQAQPNMNFESVRLSLFPTTEVPPSTQELHSLARDPHAYGIWRFLVMEWCRRRHLLNQSACNEQGVLHQHVTFNRIPNSRVKH